MHIDYPADDGGDCPGRDNSSIGAPGVKRYTIIVTVIYVLMFISFLCIGVYLKRRVRRAPRAKSQKCMCGKKLLLNANVTSFNITVVLMVTLCNPFLRLHLRSIQLNGFYVFG